MRITILIILSLIVVLSSCHPKEKSSAIEIILVDKARIDSIRGGSDTNYTRMIGAGEFNKAEQWVSKKDSSITKVLKDTADRIVGIVKFKRGIRVAYEEYYPNGQLKGKLPLNEAGQFDGASRYYHENGRVKMEGDYKNGFFRGSWRNYDEHGRLLSIDEYDANGQMIKSKSN